MVKRSYRFRDLSSTAALKLYAAFIKHIQVTDRLKSIARSWIQLSHEQVD